MISINNRKFKFISEYCQLSFGVHASIYYEFDIYNNPEYLDFFINKYDNKERFDIISNSYIAISSIIKAIDVQHNSLLIVNITCDIFNTSDIYDRRDKKIGDIIDDQDNTTFN